MSVPGHRPSEPLYDLVGAGMWAYTSAAFRVRRLASPDWRLERGEMLVAVHRAETDVPVICGQVFFAGGVYRQHHTRLSFAAREDMFDRGFFGGFPPELSRRTRRLLFPLRAGGLLPLVRVSPVPYPGTDVLRVGRALESVPAQTPLADVLPPAVLARFAERAGREEPRVAADVLRGEYADLLWESYPRDVLDAPLLQPVWRRRSDRATEDIRAIIELVRSGEPVLFFPEGRPSPDGDVGPLRPGLRLLVRRAAPRALRPVGLAYDSITCRRTLAYVAFGDTVAPPTDEVDEQVLGLLRRSLPLTCGQIVATALLEAATAGAELSVPELARRFASRVAEADASRRPVDPAFRDEGARQRRLADALSWAVSRGLVVRRSPAALTVNQQRVVSDATVSYAAREAAIVLEG